MRLVLEDAISDVEDEHEDRAVTCPDDGEREAVEARKVWHDRTHTNKKLLADRLKSLSREIESAEVALVGANASLRPTLIRRLEYLTALRQKLTRSG